MTRVTAGLAFLMLVTTGARSATLYSTGFEDPPFANGSELLGQDGWSTAIPPFLNPNAAVISNDLARSGTQSLKIAGSDLIPAVEVGPLAVVGSYRRPVNYDAGSGNSRVLITSDVRLDGPVLGTGDFFASNIAARSGDGGIGELSISSDGKVYGYTGNFDGTILVSSPITLGEWHTLGISVDFAANNYTFLVDGATLGTFPFENGFTSDTLVRGAAVVYGFPDDPAAGSLLRKDQFTAHYDNFTIATVPDHGSTGAFFCGVMSLMALKRRAASRSGGKSRGK